jgi:outer membrane protein OmpA-like peptidoglycan-associated protein
MGISLLPILRPSKWKIITSSGGAGSLGEILSLGGTHVRLYLSTHGDDRADSPGVVQLTFNGGGAGVGVTAVPFVDASYSTASMLSFGEIYHGASSSAAEIELRDLIGFCLVQVAGAGALKNVSVTQIFFRPKNLTGLIKSTAVGIVYGVGRGLPSIGAMEYAGWMSYDRMNSLVSKDAPIPVDHRIPKFRNIPAALTLPADALFDFDRSELKPAADPILQQAVDLLKRQPVSFVIEGHTDSKGPPQHNLILSRARAETVKKWLVDHGLPNASNLKTVGWGATHPAAANTNPDGADNPAGRQRNRRVSFAWPDQ